MSLNLRRDAEPVPGYRLIERLGQGGSGQVWEAEGPGGFQVALKFVPLTEPFGLVELHGLQTIREIRHPHLLTTFGSWQSDDHLIIAMELAERTLLDRFREAAGQGFAGIPAPEIFEHFLDAAKGLDYMNEPRHLSPEGEGRVGIQHCDIKPQNLLLVGGSVKVADFGLARILEHSRTSHTDGLTPPYAAPEFFDEKTSSQSDQYSLAMTYCHLRGGRIPFNGSFVEIISGHALRPPDLTMLPVVERPTVDRALAKAPRDRWPSCRAFVQAVTSAMAPIQFYSVFISYSSQDRDFADRLYADLQAKGIRCWFDHEHLKIGDEIRNVIEANIRVHDKLLLVLSAHSVASEWVCNEVETALEQERRRKHPVLFPVRLDDAVMETEAGWAGLVRRRRHIGDFRGWEEHDAYKKAFARLLRDLKAEDSTAK